MLCQKGNFWRSIGKLRFESRSLERDLAMDFGAPAKDVSIVVLEREVVCG